MIRPLAIFDADFPDDTIDDDDEIVRFGGRNVAHAIQEMLHSDGYKLTEPEYEHEHGWTFHATRNGFEAWFQIQGGGGRYYLSTKSMQLFKFTRKAKAAYAGVLRTVSSGLNADPRIRDVLWYSHMNPPGELGSTDPVVSG